MPHTIADPQLSPAELTAWRGLLRVHANVIKALDAELEVAHGMSVSSYEVLLNLSRAPEQRLRMRDLAEVALLTRSGLSRLVDRLTAEGLLERAACPSDARGAFAVLTPRGLEALRSARPTHLDGVRRRFLEHFSPEELDQLTGLWGRVLPDAST